MTPDDLNRQAAMRGQQAPAPAPQATPYQAASAQTTAMRPMGQAAGYQRPQAQRPQTLNDYQNRAQQFGAMRTMLGARQANPQGYAPRQQFQAAPQMAQGFQRPPMQGGFSGGFQSRTVPAAPAYGGANMNAMGSNPLTAQLMGAQQAAQYQAAPQSGFSGGFQASPQTAAQAFTGRAFTPQAAPALGAGQMNAAQLNGYTAGQGFDENQQRMLALQFLNGGG